MKERPILFSGAMVRALLDGSKTQTRRVVKAKPSDECPQEMWPHALKDIIEWREQKGRWFGLMGWRSLAYADCPYGKPGDRLWVREAWRVGKPHDETPPRDILPPLLDRGKGVTVLYEAGGWRSVGPAGREEPNYPANTPMPEWAGKLRPSMFMPRAFSRLTLELTDVRVERLQDISEADAQAEGVERDMEPCDHIRQSCEDIGCLGQTHKASFCNLWCDLNGIPSWMKNPWVWIVEFKRIDE